MSYITPSLATKLNLKPVAAHTVSIKTFGNHGSQEVLNKVNVCFITSEGEDISINCFAKDICAPLTGQQFTHKNDYDHLKNLNLADSYNSGHVPIDILIGADSYWKFMENNIITVNSGPVAIKSKFGFVLSCNIGPVSNDCSVMVSHVFFINRVFSLSFARKRRRKYLNDQDHSQMSNLDSKVGEPIWLIFCLIRQYYDKKNLQRGISDHNKKPRGLITGRQGILQL